MLELHFLEGSQAGKTVRINFETAWFGRQPTCDFVIEGEGVSRAHFSIVKRGTSYVLLDNKSTNGTFVNRVRTNAVTLKPGYIISAGSCVMEVRETAPEPVATSFRFVVEYLDEEATAAQRVAQVFEQSSILVGRKTICQVNLNELDVSPVHAELSMTADGVFITDQSADVGLHINGQRVIKKHLSDGDVIQIRPFELSVALKQGLCVLRIRRAAFFPTGSYRAMRTGEHPTPAKQLARPSDSIAALPDWQHEKAPIYIPSSDLLPNRARLWALIGSMVLVAAGTAYAWASSKSFFVPGPILQKHVDAPAECASCHIGLGRVQDTACQACHQDNVSRAFHAKAPVSCGTCHPEHKGAQFDFARAIGATCQSAGCHVSVHEKLKPKLTSKDAVAATLEIPFLGDKDKGSFEVKDKTLTVTKLPADSQIHVKHDQKGVPCEGCHAAEDLSPRNEVRDAKGKVAEPGVERRVRRERCMQCHSFGPDATLQSRCIGCHFEHAADADKAARFVRTSGAAAEANVRDSRPGFAYVIAALCAFPLFYVVWTASGLRLNSARARALAAAEAKASRPAPVIAPVIAPAPTAAEAGKTKSAAQTANLRPRINLDLCVGCGSCVHVCPFNVLDLVDEKAKAVRMDDCTGYAACVAECPTEAIVLVDQGAARTQELPSYDSTLETNVPGLFLAGEVTGKALIKVAINQGRSVVADGILRNRPQAVPPMYDVIVVGAGPAGTSSALAAMQAGLRVLVLEQGTTANTINSYPRQKFVMAEPVMLPLAGPLWMEDTSKESLLERWNEIIQRTGLVINEGEKVLEVVRHQAGHFGVRSTKGEYVGARVVLAIGKRGSPRKLGVPGEDSSKVAYGLLDAEAYQGKAICIVGGGDSGIEAANGLARPDLNNRVFLVHRAADFGAAKPRNQKKIRKNMDGGLITAFLNSGVTEIRSDSVIVKTEQGLVQIPNDFVFVMIGGENPKKFLSQCGIEFSQRVLA